MRIGHKIGLCALLATAALGQTTFSNTSAISCATGVGAAAADFAVGVSCASYPSNIAVSGMAGTISRVDVRLNNLSVEREQDMILLLVGPNGSNLILLSDAGRSTTSNTSGVTMTLTDTAASVLAQEAAFTNGASFRPSGHNTGLPNRKDNFASPAPAQGSLVYPAPSGSSTLASQFNGINPNGTWALYVMDDALGPAAGGSTGINMAGGWSLIITTAVSSLPTSTSVTSSVNPSTTGNLVTFPATVTSGGNPVTLGQVTFFVDNVQQGSAVPLNGSGQASFSTSSLAEGSHTIRADYGGATGFGTSNGSLTQVVNNQTTVNGTTYCNTGAITTTDGSISTPYPSNIFVSGASGTIVNVSLQLKGLTSSRPDDLDLLLVGPGAQKFVPMSDVGTTTNPVAGLNITLDDTAGSQLPDEGALTSGTFRPTGVATGDTFASPAPAGPYTNAAPSGAGTFTNLFGGASPNGTWALHVVDDGIGGGNSSLAQGWCLAFTLSSAPATTTSVTSSVNPSFTGGSTTFTATVRLASNNSLITQGTVTFREGATVLAGPTVLNGSGQASFATSSLTEGTHVITADYNGVAGTFNISNSSVTQTVNNQTTVNGTTYCNPGPLNLNDSGPATQYPQRIFVSGLTGVIQKVTLQLRGLTTARPDDLDLLLVGPNAAKFVVMSDAGGALNAVSNQTLTLDDAAGSALPDESSLVTGTFRPSSYNALNLNNFPAPAPGAPWSNAAPNGAATFASLFQGASPNGTWELYAVDDGVGGGAGSLATGYCVTFTLASDLTISKTHSGDFTQGQTGAQYSIEVSNVGAAAATGSVVVTDTLPAGLTATAISGSGWNCSLGTLSCERSDGLAASSAFPAILVTVNVASNAPASVTNQATVSGGGDLNTSNNSDSDLTTVVPLVSVTVGTSPAGLSFSVDGTPYTSQQTFQFPQGSNHTIATTATQGNASTQNVFLNWSDSGPLSHSITVPASATSFTANFKTQHFLTTQVAPGGSGTIAPPSGFYDAGSVPVTATANSGFSFANFSGALSGSTNPQNLNLTAPATVTANFEATLVSITVNTSPAGLSYSVDGTPYTSQQTFQFAQGSNHTIATTTPQGNASTQHVFLNWSDNGALSHSITVGASPTTFTANFQRQHFLTTQVSPAGGGTITPPSGFFNEGNVQVSAAANGGFTFANFSGALSGSTNPQTLNLTGPATVTANFNGSGSVLSSLVTGKTGAANARVWTFRLTNSGAGTAANATVNSVAFTQQAGAACTPVVTSALPSSAGTIAPAGTGNALVTIDFSSCAATARFRVDWTFSANGGADTGSMTLFNQFR